jgi:hypothetical protein
MFVHYRRFRPNLGLLPRIALAAAIACVVVLATVGAVVGAVLLAIGALVHWVLRRLRPLPVNTRAAAGAGAARIYEGEFQVVDPAHPLPRALSSDTER